MLQKLNNTKTYLKQPLTNHNICFGMFHMDDYVPTFS